jgi:hypothetical protein
MKQMSTQDEIDFAREECIGWGRHLAHERRELEFQMERVKNAEAGLASAKAKWEAIRASLSEAVS